MHNREKSKIGKTKQMVPPLNKTKQKITIQIKIWKNQNKS